MNNWCLLLSVVLYIGSSIQFVVGKDWHMAGIMFLYGLCNLLLFDMARGGQ